MVVVKHACYSCSASGDTYSSSSTRVAVKTNNSVQVTVALPVAAATAWTRENESSKGGVSMRERACQSVSYGEARILQMSTRPQEGYPWSQVN